ncbi:MAG: (E)-4-hydroxy-3-methylbut-2-enyl-diphosphate synthase [Tannerella sp.]|nr:(E)-4-hydroxy-3-methylbut-2-enyl-diphosphate synthase [Tannerella sp.]
MTKIYQRRQTSVVNIGNTPMGGSYPIRIQSMSNVSTMDTDAAVAQSIRMIDAGAEYIRFTAQSGREARNLGHIRQLLREKGYQTPLVADIHFTPKVADIATEHVEKVRINPGNYTKQTVCATADWDREIRKIRERFIPFLELCRRHGTAIRIGVNHGSLSERIVNRFGDTPEGMAESCMEFLRICKEKEFDDVVVSVKSSNTVVMVRTVRLLVQKMQSEAMQYPLHLGVTEAGDDEEGRIKSAVGMGALLIDGIGDTIRVSLSEAPEAELPVARKLVDYILEREHIEFKDSKIQGFRDSKIQGFEDAKIPVVISDRRNGDFRIDPMNPPDFLYVGLETDYPSDMPIPILIDMENWHHQPGAYPYFHATEIDKLPKINAAYKFLELSCPAPDDTLVEILRSDPSIRVVLNYEPVYSVYQTRMFVQSLIEAGCNVPVILRCNYHETDPEHLQLKAAIDFGALLIDGIGNGVFLVNEPTDPCLTDRTMFNILQAARARISKTEYISCPGCGRTLYNLQTTITRIKAATSHLKGLKIGIMGCIVNGPGEMADADYGYVGAGRGRISLYKGKVCVLKNIPEEEAVERLVGLIREKGDWGELLNN